MYSGGVIPHINDSEHFEVIKEFSLLEMMGLLLSWPLWKNAGAIIWIKMKYAN